MGTRRERAVTRGDVARLAGVSTAVVSYVVNDGPRGVAPATRGRVLEAIDRLGYRPNVTARALRTGETGLIGLVVPEVLNPYYAEFIEAMDVAAAGSGTSILLGITHRLADEEARTVQSLVDHGVDGLIYEVDLGDDELYLAGGPDMRRVLLDHSQPVPGLATVGADSEGGARAVVEHLIGHGHRRIGYIGAPMHGRKLDLRRMVWERTVAEEGLEGIDPVITTWSREGGYEGAKELMARDRPPTAIFAGSDFIGIGVLRALHELGLDVPGDVAVASFDGTAESAFSWPPLTTVRQPFEQMARRTFEVLGATAQPAGSSVFPMQLVVRASCGCRE